MAQKKRSNPSARKRAVIIPALTTPRDNPFFGLGHGQGAPARETQIPHLTAQVQIAKARQERLNQGGLLTPQQRAQEQRAAKTLAKPEKRDSVTAPKRSARTTPSQSNPPLVLGAPPAALSAALPNSTPARTPRPPARRGAPTRYRGMTTPANQGGGIDFGFLNQPLIGKDASNAVGKVIGELNRPASRTASNAAQKGLAAVSVPTGQLNQPLIGNNPLSAAYSELHRKGQALDQAAGKESLALAAKIRTAGEKAGSINISLLSDAQAKQFPGQKTVNEQQLRELEAQKGGLGGLPKATRHTLIEGAVSNGWPRQDVIKMVDSDLIHVYGNKPANPVIQFVKNAGSFAATQAAAPAGFAAIADAAAQAAKGDTTPIKKIGQQFVEGTIATLPLVGDRPFAQNLYWHPGETAQNFLLGAGATDRVLGKVAKFAEKPRYVTPEGFTTPVSRGTLSPRPINRSVQALRDAYVRAEPRGPFNVPVVGPKARRTAIAKEAYAATRERAIAPVLAQSGQLRADVMRTANKVGKERAAALNAHLQGTDAAERTAFYQQVSKELGFAKGRGAAAHAKLSEKHPITDATLTPKDREYVDAVRAAAEFSTQTRVKLGQFGDTAAKYRAYQEPIVIAAQNGDELAQEVIHTRGQHLWPDPEAKPVPVSSAAQTRLRTIEAQAAKHEDEYGRLERVANVKPKRPPKGSGVEKQAAWRDELKKYNSRARTARAKMQVHRTQADQLNAKAEAIRSRLRSQDASAEGSGFSDEATHAAYRDALDQFIARHQAEGGTTPAFIPQVVPQTLTSSFRREASVTASGKIPGVKATQNKLVLSGGYRSTPADVSLEAHRAAVVRARVDHFNAVRDEYATRAVNGAEADPNVVYVKADNLRSPVKLEHTVAEHNLTDEDVHSTLDSMRQMLEGGTVQPISGFIPSRGDILAVPKTIYDELHASTVLPKGAPIGEFYDKANRAYQRFMLSKPSTGVSNIAGNPVLAAMGGAGPLDILKGYDLAKNHPEWVPPQLLKGGLAAQAGQKVARTPVGKYINFSLSKQRASEDAARAALYHHHAHPYVVKKMKETGDSADKVLRDLAEGRDPQGAVFVKKVEDFLGSMRNSKRMSPETEKFLGRSILFHRWLGHILTLSLYTMPVKYPGRAVFLQRVSEIGDEYRKHHGVFPTWYRSMLPLMQYVATEAGVPEAYTRVLPTGTIWPTANMPMPLSDAEGANPWSAIIGSTQPVVRAALESPTGMNWANLRPYKDAKGSDIGPGLNLGLLAGQQYRNLPYAGYVTPFAGKGDTAYPGNWVDRVNKNKYGKPLPPGFGTSAKPYGGNTPSLTPEYLLGFGSRMLFGGSGVQDLPAQTRGTNYSRTKQIVTARKGRNKIIRERAQARAKKG